MADLYACNAVMLADDKTRSIFFDSIQGDNNLYCQPEDFKPCFDGVKLPDTIKDTSYDPFLSSMSHVKLHKSQNAFDTASYLRLAYNVNRTLKPKTVKGANACLRKVRRKTAISRKNGIQVAWKQHTLTLC